MVEPITMPEGGRSSLLHYKRLGRRFVARSHMQRLMLDNPPSLPRFVFLVICAFCFVVWSVRGIASFGTAPYNVAKRRRIRIGRPLQSLSGEWR